MKNKKLLKSASFLMILAMGVVFSCKDEERLTVQDTKDISEEAVTDSYFQDMDDMAGVAVETPDDQDYSGGRAKAAITFTVNDTRFRCGTTPLTVTLERTPNSTPDHPVGVITVDFGTTGCEDVKGNVRKGKLIFTYNGRRFMPGSTIVTTTADYSINGVELSGTRTVTNRSESTVSAPRFNVVLTNGVATFEDGSTAERTSNITYHWVRATSPLNDQLVIEEGSTASGNTRGGRDYTVSILEDVEFLRSCGFPVSGIKHYVIDGEKEITIDYGDGNCDRSLTVTVNGITRNISVN